MVDASGTGEVRPAVALLGWSGVVEDLLEPLGLSLEAFCNEFRGSWIFGYAEALSSAGLQPVVVYMSEQLDAPFSTIHAPSGARICLLPAPRLYRRVRRSTIYPYGQTVREMFGEIRGRRLLLLPLYAVAKELALYLATPIGPLARLLREEGCRTIICGEYEYPRFDLCVLLGRAMHLHVFGCFQGGNYHHSRLERFVRPLSIRAARGLIIGSAGEVDRVRARYRIPRKRVARIFNPIDASVWRPFDRTKARATLGIPPGAGVVAWHGRVALDKKGLDVLLSAWERICQMRAQRDPRLLLIGTGDDAAKLRRRLETSQLPGVVWVDRFVNDPAELRRYLCAADVYVFPSRYEGFPVAPLEAMGCGLPVVASDAEGIAEILAGSEAAGGLVVPREDPGELARALVRFLDDPEWSRDVGRRARARVLAAFSLDATGARLRALIDLDG